MTLFEVDWMPQYLSILRSAIALGTVLIVAVCIRSRREQVPINWRMTALVFGVGAVSNFFAAIASANPMVSVGLILCVVNTFLVIAVWSYALFGLRMKLDGWDDP